MVACGLAALVADWRLAAAAGERFEDPVDVVDGAALRAPDWYEACVELCDELPPQADSNMARPSAQASARVPRCAIATDRLTVTTLSAN